MPVEEISLDDIQKAIDCLDNQPVHGTMIYVDGINVCGMPKEVKARIKWAFDHIYISDNLVQEGEKDANLRI